MRRLFDRIGTVPGVIVTILGVIVAGLIVLALLALADGATSASLGALALAVIAAVPMTIVYLVARGVRGPATPAIMPPPPPPPSAGGFQPYPADEQRLHNTDDLR